MIGSSRSYAIGMAHFRLGGGWKTVCIILGVYLTLFVGGASLFFYENYMVPGAAAGGRGTLIAARVVLAFLMGMQGFALLFVGGGRASNAVRLDLSSNMIESHRLMPISSSQAVWGYLLGPTLPAILFVALNGFLSMGFAAAVGTGNLDRIVINQAVVFAFAGLVWVCAVMGTFAYRPIFALIVAGVIFGSFARLFAYAVLPGLGVLMTPFVGETIFNFGFVTPSLDLNYAVGMAGQLALFLIFFAGSCRLYRGTCETAFNSGLGTLFLTVWAALSAFGIHLAMNPANRGLFMVGPAQDVASAVQIVATLAVSVALSVAALWPFVHEERSRPRVWVSAMYVLLMTGLVCLPLIGARGIDQMSAGRAVATVISCGAQVTVLYCMLRIMRKTKFIFALIVAGAVTVALWVGPLLLEALRINFFSNGPAGQDGLSILGYLSPIAMLGQLWAPSEIAFPLAASLVWQWMAAGMALALVVFAARRAGAKAQMREFPVIPARPALAAVTAETPQFASPSHGADSAGE